MGRISQCAPYLATMQQWIDEGLSTATIARRLGLSHMQVSTYLRRRGIYTKHGHKVPHKVDEQQLQTLRAAGHTIVQIAEALGVAPSAIDRRRRHLGLETVRTGPRAAHDHPEWRGGRRLEKHAYIGIYVPLHPHAKQSTASVQEHRLIMEVLLGRYLLPTEVINHQDNHPHHNWPDNLELFASNADHLRAELTDRVKATPRASIPGAYGNNQKIPRCPDADETLVLCPVEIRQKLDYYIESHRPTLAHQKRPRRTFLRTGAWRDPFQEGSRA